MTSNSSTELLNSLPETLPNAEEVVLEETNSGSISGVKWNDLDGDGEKDVGEPGLEGWTIYLDTNHNGELDVGELSTVTDEEGNYSFLNLPGGNYTVAEVLQPSWQLTYPKSFPREIQKLTDNSYPDYAPQISGNNVFWQTSVVNYIDLYLYNGSQILQLSDRDYSNEEDIYFQMSGDRAVWSASDGNDREIYFYNGNQVIQLTDNNDDDSDFDFLDNKVVWSALDGNDREIYLYDGNQVVQLTDNDFYDFSPQISGENVVWSASDDREIYLYDGSQVVQLTSNADFNSLEISGNNLVWSASDGNDSEIYLYDGSQVVQLTDNNVNDSYPDISGNNVVWSASDGNNSHIYFYNGSQVLQLTDTANLNSAPQISGNSVVWQAFDDNDSEIYLYTGNQVVQLTNNDVSEYNLKISGNQLVWLASDGNDQEIYLYDGSQVLQVTNNNVNDSELQISGNNLVWSASDGNDSEIYTLGLGNTHSLSLIPGEAVSNINFGNWKPITLSGTKWHDLDGDDTQDTDEPGLEGWTIYLDANNNGELDEGENSTLTDEEGNYSFTLPEGTYTVAEQLQAGWVQTLPIQGSYTVSLDAGEVAEDLDFGNQAQPGEISGSKWHDLDGDGEKDVGEPTLEGWTIFLDANQNGALDEGELSTVTDAEGNYSFTNLPIGTYTVAEQLQPDWQPTNPVGVPGQIVRLTHNNLNESNPQVSGQNIVWQAHDGNDTEVYFYDGSQVVQLTDNNEEDSLPQISGNHIVWQGSDGNDTEIYLYDGTQVVQLTDNDEEDSLPQISGNNIVWQGSDGNDTEIYSYDGSQVVQLTENEVNDSRPLVSGNNIVWAHELGSPYFYDLYFYNGSQVIAITDNVDEPTSTYGFDISGDTVVWEENDGYLNTYLKLYNSDNAPGLSAGQYNTSPKISGNNVVWKTHDDNGENNQLYFYNGSDSIPLHIADPTIISVQYEYEISGNKVVWQVDDEMYLYDGDKIVTLTNNNFSDSDPQIDGNTIAWLGNDGNDTEIYTVSLENAHTVTLNPGETIANLNFGNWQPVTLSGTKWNDLDGDGTRDAEESGLGGWTIYLDANNNGELDTGETSTLTDADGNYSFILPDAGTYTVAEVQKTGWSQTAPTQGSYTVSLEAGEVANHLDFGNQVQPGEISGTKWNDLDGDSIKDEGEPGIEGWTIYLDSNRNGELDTGELSTVTDAEGNYSFTDLTEGLYIVTEEQKPDWTQTYPSPYPYSSEQGTYQLYLRPGETFQNRNFGNWQPATISGTKWNDTNCNGIFDSTEAGLSGWTIYLDANTNGQLDSGEVSTTTAADGSYSFRNVAAGSYTVAEVQQTGWEQTAPTSGSHTIEVSAGEVLDHLDFGNRQSVFNGTKNADHLTGTICADTLNGLAGNDTLQGLDDNDVLNGRSGNDVLYGDKGNDLVQGNAGNDVVVGGGGNDSLFGASGLDTLIGVDTDAIQPGMGEIDQFRGNADADLFVLGDALTSYYNDGNNTNAGVSDYGWIKDFVVGEDVIQLSGSASNYFLAASPAKLPKGTAIFLETGTTDELIGIVRNVPLAQLDLASSSFSYV
jgi:beta propeller repeat protein